MTAEARVLQQRRELLVARSAVQRLELAQDLGLMRQAVSAPRIALAIGGIALGVAGLGRFGRVVRVAAMGVALVKVLRSFLRR